MKRVRAVFQNKQNESLSGLLELPDGMIKCYAIFAHCFTCSKDGLAATYISRKLAVNGIAVLRFDFTGLGNSSGDFSNSSFSSNIDDLIAASDYLNQYYEAPQLLIGHSLGGAAVLAVSQHMDTIKAVVTINSPATADHVKHLFIKTISEIQLNEGVEVSLGGRSFTIRKQFLDDLEQHNTLDHIGRLNKALLIFHSPIDQVVSINEAARIYSAAKHPKSFISLDDADHLLSNKGDADYIAGVVSAWVTRYLKEGELKEIDKVNDTKNDLSIVKQGVVIVRESDKKFAREISTKHHKIISDEPLNLGGTDLGANPYELLLAALGSCTSMTLRMYANHKKLDLADIVIELYHERIHAKDCEACESEESLADRIHRSIKLTGNLNDDQRNRLLEIANLCPVHKTLQNRIIIETELIE